MMKERVVGRSENPEGGLRSSNEMGKICRPPPFGWQEDARYVLTRLEGESRTGASTVSSQHQAVSRCSRQKAAPPGAHSQRAVKGGKGSRTRIGSGSGALE